MKLEELLKKFAKNPNNLKHLANCHFPGLYSIALEERGGNLTRAFIARPGELHPDLQQMDSWTLWHNHAYDFTETVVAGAVVNRIAKFSGYSRISESEELFNAFKFSSGILNKIQLEWDSVFSFTVQPGATYFPAQSFSMTTDQIHRVTFHPDTETGWFCAVVEETRQWSRPYYAYVPAKFGLDKPLYLDKLYTNIETEEAVAVVSSLLPNIATMRR